MFVLFCDLIMMQLLGTEKDVSLIVGYAFLHTASMSDLNSQLLVTLLCSSTCAFLPSEYVSCLSQNAMSEITLVLKYTAIVICLACVTKGA